MLMRGDKLTVVPVYALPLASLPWSIEMFIM